MDFKQISQKLVGNDDQRAVSPVIGVILMVAITVILAAVIAAFVLDMGDMGDTAPTTSFEWDQNGDEVTVTHQSGDGLDPDKISVEGATINGDWESGDEITAGDTATLSGLSDTIQIVWKGDDGSSQVIDSYEPSDTDDLSDLSVTVVPDDKTVSTGEEITLSIEALDESGNHVDANVDATAGTDIELNSDEGSETTVSSKEGGVDVTVTSTTPQSDSSITITNEGADGTETIEVTFNE